MTQTYESGMNISVDTNPGQNPTGKSTQSGPEPIFNVLKTILIENSRTCSIRTSIRSISNKYLAIFWTQRLIFQMTYSMIPPLQSK